MAIVISQKIEDKLKEKHSVNRREVEQCFDNILGKFLYDTREKHDTDPRTQWFISQTNNDRILKVVFVFKDGNFYIRTAYEPNQQEVDLYISKH